jgi:biotin operon repressor
VKYLQLPEHLLTLDLTVLELKIYCDVWTMKASGNSYWKSNDTIATAFGVEKRSVVRAIARLESRGFLLRRTNDKGRYLEALIPKAKGDPSVMGDPAVMGDRDCTEGDPAVMGGVTEMVPRDDSAVIQIENKREVIEDKSNRESASLVFPWSSESFEIAWNEWREYKRKQFKFKYKSVNSEQIALHKLHRDTNGDERNAIEAIVASIANGYRGIFPSNQGKGKNVGRNLDW